ncbi:MAG TPA: multidrug effflux MFS transporter [Salinisphaeraceae bacterium]|nr:multidrug effflux MFS transporter [Salinisphaeraceae bacterium]
MSNSAQQRIPRPSLPLLAFMMSLGPFGDTEYTPAMPEIARSLDVDYSMVQFTMASYLIGMALSELFYGALADRFGRRPVMLVGAGILTAGALICLVSFSIWPLIGGRMIQGVGATAGGVIAKAAVRDAFASDQRERVYAQLNAAFALAPAIGPILGSIIAQSLDWHINFAVLAALSALLWLLTWRYLPETKPKVNARALQPARLWRSYKRPLAAPDFLFYAVLGGCCIGVVYTALIGAPDLVLNVLGMGTFAIIIVALAVLIGFASGAGLCAWLSKRLRDLYLLSAGLGVLLAGSFALLAVALVVGEQGTLAMYLTPIGFCFFGVGLIVPVSTANAMAPFNRIAGAASSVLGFTRMGIAAIGTIAMSLLHQSSVYDMPIVFLGLSGLASVIFVAYVALRGLTPAKSRS